MTAASGVAAGLMAAGALMTPLVLTQVVTWLVLPVWRGLGEAVRRVRELAGVSIDLLSAWTLPVAFAPADGVLAAHPGAADGAHPAARGMGTAA